MTSSETGPTISDPRRVRLQESPASTSPASSPKQTCTGSSFERNLHGSDERYGMIFRVKPGIPNDQVNAEFQSFHEKFAKTAPSYLYPEPPFRTQFMSVNEGILGKFANTRIYHPYCVTWEFSMNGQGIRKRPYLSLKPSQGFSLRCVTGRPFWPCWS